jgi:hypothetical protein
MMPLIKPKVITVKDLDGVDRSYTISRFPTVDSREIITQYPVTGLPKIGDYKSNAELAAKIMCYVEVQPMQGEPIRLTTEALRNNHIPDGETHLRIEWEAMGYNTSFFGAGKTLSFLEGFKETLKAWILSILMDLSERSSRTTKPL